MRSWWGLLILWVACTSHDDLVVDRARCEQLRTHLVDLRLADLGKLDVDKAAHRTAIENALGDPFVTSCQQSITVLQMNCALAAKDSAAAASCTSR